MNNLTKEEFLQKAREGNLIPVTRRLLADFETPLSAYCKLRGEGESFLFESVEGGEHLGRYSLVGSSPRIIIKQKEDHVGIYEAGTLTQSFSIVGNPDPAKPEEVCDALEVVQKVLDRYNIVVPESAPIFTGGAVGFIGYEYIHDVETTVPRPPGDDLGTPVVYFIIADQHLVFDRVNQTVTIWVNAFIDEAHSPEQAYEDALKRIDVLVEKLRQPFEFEPVTLSDSIPDVSFESNMKKEVFLDYVRKAKDYIVSGDIIQVVGSQRFSTLTQVSAVDLYRAARTINPSPYMFLLELDEFSLVGASPEIHVRCDDGKVEIRPIAGTRPRGKSRDEDLNLEEELLADPKERAEHVMLVDLARNDIGRVCDYGSVEVKDLMITERYSHVMHIVSQVEGRLTEGHTPYDLIRATFPAGTLSGAPKVRAMQIISEFEQTRRGPYGGCVGYFSFDGNLDCCITIRTALLKDGKVYVQAGGGWVYDSVPENEYQETINKAKSMLKAVAMAEQFQTGEG